MRSRGPGLAPVLVRRPGVSGAVLATTVAGITLLQLHLRRGDWVGWTPGTISAWTTAVAVGPPSVTAAVAGWWSGAPRRCGLDLWLPGARRRQRRAATAAAIGAGLWAAVGALGSLAVALCMTLVRGGALATPWGATTFAVLGVILSLLCVAAAAGLAAVHLPAGIVTPAAVVLPYMWYFVTAGYGSGTSAATVGPADGIVWDFVATSATTTALRALFWAALTLVLVSALRRSRLRHLARWSLGAVTALVILGGFATADIPGAQDVTCDGTSPAICLTANQEASRPEVTAATQQALSHLPAAARLPAISSMDSPTGAAHPVLPPSKVVDPEVLAGHIGVETMLAGCRDGARGRVGAEALLHWWWTANELPLDEPIYPGAPIAGDLSPEALAASTRVARMSADERDRLLTRLTPSIVSCTVRATDLR